MMDAIQQLELSPVPQYIFSPAPKILGLHSVKKRKGIGELGDP